MAERKYLRCKSGFVLPGPTVIKTGQAVPADDPVVKGRAYLFEPLEDGIEMMTRAPGEKRLNLQRPTRTVLSAPAARRRGKKKSTSKQDTADESTAAESSESPAESDEAEQADGSSETTAE